MTNTPDLYLDIIYTGDGTGIAGAVINERHPIHFPLRLSTSLTFDPRDGTPYMVLKTVKVMSDVDEIIDGDPQYGLTSELTLVLKRQVAKKIIKMAEPLEGKTAFELELPIFKGVGLENTWYEVSAHGRVNLYFKL